MIMAVEYEINKTLTHKMQEAINQMIDWLRLPEIAVMEVRAVEMTQQEFDALEEHEGW